jgi:hypothetical protein
MMFQRSHSQPGLSISLEKKTFGLIDRHSMPMNAMAPRENATDRTKHFSEK